MNSSAACSLLLSVCLILIFHSPLPTNATSLVHHKLLGVGPDLIDQVCTETIEDNSYCKKILRQDPEVVQAKNFTELAVAIMKFGLKKGREGKVFLKGYLVKGKTNPVIEECATSGYAAVIRSFDSALGELAGDRAAANYEARIAGDGADACDKAMNDAHIDQPAIFELNHQVEILSFMAYAAISRIP